MQALHLYQKNKSNMVTYILIKFVLVLFVFLLALTVAAYSTYGERKVSALMQDRIGPDRAGPYGLLQPLADGIKMFTKEELIPTNSSKYLFVLGPSIAMLTALMAGVVIPWAGPIEAFGQQLTFQVSDINIGILYIFSVVSIGVYGIMIGGWASNNKYSLLGALRASSQMISYEIAMGLAIVALVMKSGTLSLGEIVTQQQGDWINVVYQPLGFLIFLICAFAETNRAPFDLPECETELIGGYHTEYSSMKLGLFLFAEYINMFVSSAVISALYFGGYNLPFQAALGLEGAWLAVLQFGFFFLKIVFFIFLFMWVRWTIPRFRYDQLLHLGWKILLPLAILNIIITGLVMWANGSLA
ncbi:MAG: NADH-quinone oxidoreductase subunit NuoH [Saprospiraceae bacterium]|nr:NADH-quinone oxidoreductase subunit NuoH [Saprospiraceae bacterium]MBK8850610.1 NADH-quinone oxidoreductase subunit NuoH [Saprospiraceae bacterium]MBK9689931.1 NADH-quinone oxidoreductase subunit NuoH [Saprospiraceae bacterium]MBL0081037.1 NADH-quinone oxidoreductase subunit NuoH [Saprospiraceae bacterium]